MLESTRWGRQGNRIDDAVVEACSQGVVPSLRAFPLKESSCSPPSILSLFSRHHNQESHCHPPFIVGVKGDGMGIGTNLPRLGRLPAELQYCSRPDIPHRRREQSGEREKISGQHAWQGIPARGKRRGGGSKQNAPQDAQLFGDPSRAGIHQTAETEQSRLRRDYIRCMNRFLRSVKQSDIFANPKDFPRANT